MLVDVWERWVVFLFETGWWVLNWVGMLHQWIRWLVSTWIELIAFLHFLKYLVQITFHSDIIGPTFAYSFCCIIVVWTNIVTMFICDSFRELFILKLIKLLLLGRTHTMNRILVLGQGLLVECLFLTSPLIICFRRDPFLFFTLFKIITHTIIYYISDIYILK